MNLPEIKLSDGRIAKYIRKPKVGDASKAQRMAGNKGNDIDRNAALISQIVTFDGNRLVLEDVMGLELEDFAAILEVMQYGRWGDDKQEPVSESNKESGGQNGEEGNKEGGETENFT